MSSDLKGASIPTFTWLRAGSLLCLGASLIAAEPPAATKDIDKSRAAASKAAQTFVAVDTSPLMGSPDSRPALGVEKAFPHLQFERPVAFMHAGDGSNRAFVVEQGGRIRVFPNRPDIKEAKTFLDLTGVVRREHNEEGLLGLAFHPDYAANGQFFAFYSVTPRGSVLSRFQVSKDDPDLADRSSEVKLLEFSKPYGNHNGGCLQFGPDGMLYVSIGDGGLRNDPHANAQNLETLLGKILRLDVDQQDKGQHYSVPKDNPFADRGGDVRGEIWAYGFRNVWRFAFDGKSGELWAADVGQDRHEEVNVVVRGGNYGWSIREGKYPLDPNAERSAVGALIDPVLQYPRVDGKSITGGVVYRGKRLGDLAGAYLYADFVSGNVWALRWDGKRSTANWKLARTSLLISAFGEDEAGEVYFTAFDGSIYRFREPQAGAKSASAFPRKLSDTGLFASVKDHAPAAGMIPYSVNVPLWSDGAEKERFLVLPAQGQVVFKERDKWEFPVGTVLVKTFLLNIDEGDPTKVRRLETRLWLHSPRGWEGYTYLWNEEQDEANLQADWPFRLTIDVKTAAGPEKREWYFPSRSDCQACHTHNSGFVAGWNTRQLNRMHDYGGSKENQIEVYERLGIFDNPPDKSPSELEAFPQWPSDKTPVATAARAYLDSNCAMCHSPGGSGHAGGAAMDMTFHTPFKAALGNKKWVAPGDPAGSLIVQRMKIRHADKQMPPLATNRVDEDAVKLIGQWIKELAAP